MVLDVRYKWMVLTVLYEYNGAGSVVIIHDADSGANEWCWVNYVSIMCWMYRVYGVCAIERMP